MRQIVLDTETTGLSPQQGHRLTDVGCVEIIDRKITGKVFQTHINPERELDERAAQITGLTWAKLKDKPKFAQIVDKLIDFIAGAPLIIHNAQFDLNFLTHEVDLLDHPWGDVLPQLPVIDTLFLARELHPGQRNSLDALCKRYNIDNSHRNYHGALLDAQILAQVYLTMTAGQTNLDLAPAAYHETQDNSQSHVEVQNQQREYKLKIIYANEQEQAAHAAMLAMIDKK